MFIMACSHSFNGILHVQGTSLLERQRALEYLAFFNRPLEVHQHRVEVAGLELEAVKRERGSVRLYRLNDRGETGFLKMSESVGCAAAMIVPSFGSVLVSEAWHKRRCPVATTPGSRRPRSKGEMFLA